MQIKRGNFSENELEWNWSDSGDKRESGDEYDSSIAAVSGRDGDEASSALSFGERLKSGKSDVGAEEVVLRGRCQQLANFDGSVMSAVTQPVFGFGFSGKDGYEATHNRHGQHGVVFSESPVDGAKN